MADKPLILALANPDAGDPAGGGQGGAARRDHRHRPLGLSEPGQQRAVLPVHLPRRARRRRHAITDEMKLACVQRDRRAGAGRAVGRRRAWPTRARTLTFGPEYLIPKPFDPRLIIKIAPAVAKAAMDSGVATRPIADLDAYRERLTQFVYHSGLIMKPVFARRQAARRSASSTPRARTSACCARCRSSSTRSSRSRS